jgi:hypothetical protein
MGIPRDRPAHTRAGDDHSGSLYHFTADLSAATVHVRAVIANPDPTLSSRAPVPTDCVCVLAEGLRGLAKYRAGIALRSGSACTLLFD